MQEFHGTECGNRSNDALMESTMSCIGEQGQWCRGQGVVKSRLLQIRMHDREGECVGTSHG